MAEIERCGRWRAFRVLLCAVVLSLAAKPAWATAVEEQLGRLSLEELANVQITSVSRRPEPIGEAAAAIYVITSEDIRRSGAASLPEVLRLAPNLQVQRVNSADYAITARGFNGFETSNKLLVLVDGRTIYSTLHSGIFWDIRTVMLEDIDRIEVVSGPGGALYGANAVNGVINIITKTAARTQGGLLSLGGGNEDRTLSLRQGGSLGEAGAWRAYFTGYRRDESFREGGGEATDDNWGTRGGLRADWDWGANAASVQAEIFRNGMRTNEDFTNRRTHAEGGHLQGEWRHNFEDGGAMQVQAYYDRVRLTEPGLLEVNDTYDLHMQETFDWGDRHHIVIGGGYRTIDTELRADSVAFLEPAAMTVTLANIFAQDQIDLSDTLTLTLGAKFEDNNFSGEEVLPNIRLAWDRPGGGLLWAAISRASRTPNRIERGLTFPGFLVGGDFQSEILTAYELGYRSNPTPNTAISVSAYYNDYDELRTVAPDPETILPLVFANDGRGHTYGLDAWGSWDVRPTWRLSAGLSLLQKDFEVEPGAVDISNLASIGDDPAYQLLLSSRSDLTDKLQLDLRLRAVDSLDMSGVDGYVEAGARVGWRVTDQVEFAVSGQNLLEDRRLETADPKRRRVFGRSVYAQLLWDF